MFSCASAPKHIIFLGIAAFLHASLLVLAASADARAELRTGPEPDFIEIWTPPPAEVAAEPPAPAPPELPAIRASSEAPPADAPPAPPPPIQARAMSESPPTSEPEPSAASGAAGATEVAATESPGEAPTVPSPPTEVGSSVAPARRAAAPVPRATSAPARVAPSLPSAREQRQKVAGLLSRRIDSLKRYPLVARRAGWEGVVELEVTVAPDGTLLRRRVRKSSGVPVLDNDALSLIDRASPLSLGGVTPRQAITTVVPVAYRLTR